MNVPIIERRSRAGVVRYDSEEKTASQKLTELLAKADREGLNYGEWELVYSYQRQFAKGLLKHDDEGAPMPSTGEIERKTEG